jgi:hypothetical protein
MPPKRPRPLLPSKDRTNKRSCTSSDTSHAEKPHSCDQCHKSYVDSSRLGRHKKYNHGETTKFYCEYCSRPFQRRDGLKKHINKNSCTSLNDRLDHRLWLLRHASPVSHITTMPSEHDSPYTVAVPAPASIPLCPVLPLTILDGGPDPSGEKEQAGQLDLFCDGFILFQALEIFQRCCRFYDQQKWNEARRTRPRSSYRWSFPPEFDYPPAQDLEDLLSQQGRLRRRLRVMEVFQLTHLRLLGSQHMAFLPSKPWDNRIMDHQIHLKQAWKDGVSAVRQILSGTLPRELHSVLGAAQIASAIRSAMDDVDSPITSEVTFLSDLSRWRLLLPSDSHATFDYCANILWDNIPSPILAWKEPHDVETLVYFQDLLGEMLSHIQSPPPEPSKLPSVLPSSDAPSRPPTSSTHSPSSSEYASDEVLPGVEDTEELQTSDDCKRTPLTELVLYSAGAIFALILAFILRKFDNHAILLTCY